MNIFQLRRLMGTTITVIFCGLAVGDTSNTDTQNQSGTPLTIHSQIYVDNKLLGSPTFSVVPGRQTRVSVGDTYDLILIAEPSGSNIFILSSTLTIGDNTFEPTLQIEIGQQTSVQMENTQLYYSIERVRTQPSL